MSEPKFTKGPWGWFGDPKHGGFYLATRHSGRRYVMGFDRMGLHLAQPLFQVEGEMVEARELCRFEVAHDVVGMTAAKKPGSGVYRYDIIGFNHPDAHLIAAAPMLYQALKDFVEAWDKEESIEGLALAYINAEAALAKARGQGNE